MKIHQKEIFIYFPTLIHLVGYMVSILKIDEKGRILIPSEIRTKLKLKTGEKLICHLENDIVIIRREVTPVKLVEDTHDFHKLLKKTIDKPIELMKLFE